MIKKLFMQAGIVASLLGFNTAYAVEDLSSSIYNVEISPDTVNYLQTFMPEGQALNPAYVSEQTDPNLKKPEKFIIARLLKEVFVVMLLPMKLLNCVKRA